MITAGQVRAARALLGLDQRALAELAGLSLPTIQRMEASDGVIRGNVDSLVKLVGALKAAGIELIGEGASSAPGGRGVRLILAAGRSMIGQVAAVVPAFVALGIIGIRHRAPGVRTRAGVRRLASCCALGFSAPDCLRWRGTSKGSCCRSASLGRRPFEAGCAVRLFPGADRPGRWRRQPVRHWLRTSRTSSRRACCRSIPYSLLA